MPIVVVERTFDDPADIDELQAREDGAAWCLEAHGVTFLHTYFSTDRRRMLCFYEAPDAEAVRKSQKTAGMPVSGVWTVGALDERKR